MPTPKARFGRLELLEGRIVPVAPSAVIDPNGVVDIVCGNWNDDVTVGIDGSDLVVRILSKPPNNPAHRGNVVNARFTLSDVTQVSFFGGDGNDIFRNSATGFLVAANGEGGNDQLFGGDGNEYLGGGAGDDVLKGGGGDDTIYGEAGKDTIRGGTGDDELHGGSGADDIRGNEDNDIIYGDSGNDYLKGNSGNDSLYGGTGGDTLEGNAGNDGLFGGFSSARDYLYGGADADRFLYRDSRDPRDVSSTEDARITFSIASQLGGHTPQDWTNEEVEQVDAGLRLLHDMTGNASLLKTSTNGRIEFTRRGVSLDDGGVEHPETLADTGGRVVTFYDGAFSDDVTAQFTTVHEIGHFWDNFDETNPYVSLDDWNSFSGWTDQETYGLVADSDPDDGESWFYHPDALFARTYGSNSPYEDWSTAWERYFAEYYDIDTSSSDIGALDPIDLKYYLLDNFFAELAT